MTFDPCDISEPTLSYIYLSTGFESVLLRLPEYYLYLHIGINTSTPSWNVKTSATSAAGVRFLLAFQVRRKFVRIIFSLLYFRKIFHSTRTGVVE